MNQRRGVTLIEVLVVLVILGLLLALLLPAVQNIRATANRMSCASNLRQIGVACHAYHDDHCSFPRGYKAWVNSDPLATTPGWGWATYLLPYVDQEALHQSLILGSPIENPVNAGPRMTGVPLYLCPADSNVPATFPIVNASGQFLAEAAPISYAANYGVGELDQIPGPTEGVFYRNSHVKVTSITDGASTTIMIGERAWSHSMAPWVGAINGGLVLGGPRNPWRASPEAIYPAPIFCLVQTNSINDTIDNDGGLDDYYSEHPGGVNMLFADGSVRFVSERLNHDVLLALGTRAGGEVVGPGDY
jgi:prepilin-type N-terminal cleavage/methylation domain-containing protein/prepilin-type processing-associated H-X9-DG protein